MITYLKKKPNERSRFIVAWCIVLVIIISITVIFVYNMSAIMMLFGKGNLTFQDYDNTIHLVNKNNSSFHSIDQTGDKNNGSFHYIANDQTSALLIKGQNNEITDVQAAIYLNVFADMNFLHQYQAVDAILRTIYQPYDVLASEIALLQIASRLIISGNLFKNQTTQLSLKNINVTLQLSNDKSILYVQLSENNNDWE